ncbi:MAG: IS1634 family transposase [Deltaproteobacteria bacterium]|nr:MAG: IS1634 family transposase [Deltaproteobacteria bacterium]
MFIREIEKKNSGSDKAFISHRLVQSIRTPRGPRQTVVMNLGKLDLSKEKWKELANRIEEVAYGQEMRLIEAPQEIEALAQHYGQLLIKKQLAEKKEKQSINQEQDFESINVNAVSSSENKRIGPEHVGLEAMKSLGFFDLFQQLEFTQRQSDLATLLIVGRYVHPSSERELRRYAKEQSALDELLGTSFSHIGNNALYRTSDLLFEHKDQIERFLRVRSKEIFSLKETIILYDLTNTYFTGEAPGYKRGRSKQKRNDCPLVTLGLVLDENGFVKGSRIFDGNVSEPSTLLSMVESMHEHTKKETPPLFVTKPTVVMDAGIASKENISLLKAKRFSYIVVSRTKPENITYDNFIEIKEGVKAHSIRQGDEIFLHCISEGKTKKEKSMVAKARDRMEQELKKVRQGLSKKGCLKSYPKVLERIGRMREHYSRVSKGFTITVKEHKGKATEMSWQFDKSKLGKPYDGTYFLQTDRVDLSNEDLWSIYIMLTSVEDAFRCLKSELGLRPIHHSKSDRVDGHLFISVLAYHLLNYNRWQFQKAGLNHRWPTICSWLETHELLTTKLPKEDGRIIYLRYCTLPTLKQQEIYKALKITSIPFRRKKIET